jgi:glycosyltransferase involved in cell wall biosynthesis
MAAKRLLIVVNALSFLISHRLPIALAARKAGYDVHVAGADSGEYGEIQDHGLTAHRIALSRSSLSPFQEFHSLAGLHSLYRRLRPDIVHHVTIKPVLYGTFAARLNKVAAVVNAIPGLGFIFVDGNGMKAGARRFVVQQAYRHILGHPNMRIIFQNADDQAFFRSHHIGRADQYCLIRGSGVDLELFHPTLELPEPPTVILPARMLYDKGVGDFVEAARVLKAEGTRARFVLIGPCDPGNPSAVAKDTILNWVAAGLVEWWGYRSDMHEVLSKSHIVCLPSYYREGLPKVLIEAAACGRPIVTTDTPGCRDVVQHGENGFLVPPRNGPALIDALQRLIGDSQLRQTMGRRGRARAEAMFSLETAINQHLHLYAELLNRRAA